jgi:hypothetical protein
MFHVPSGAAKIGFNVLLFQACTLLQKLSAPSDYSVSDNGCAHQMALKNNSVRQGVLMVASGWKRLH